MKILICDDEEIQRKLLMEMITDYFSERDIPYTIEEYENAEQLLFCYDKEPVFDILFLDIQMREMNGIELAKRLRVQGNHAAIIFVTGSTEYIFEGFSLSAINYLLKPIEVYKVNACLTKAMDVMEDEKLLFLQVNKTLLRIRQQDILHIQSDGHYLFVNTKETRYRIKKSLGEIEVELDDKQFYKLSRSDIISLSAIRRITSKELVLTNDETIPIPKGRHHEISEAFMHYHFHRGECL